MGKLNTVLFGKYQLCRILGTGRLGTVFLAVHLGLSEYRAIKRVPKSFLEYDQFRREALILKELRHPGIPIVYDVEEDENYSYLIEEYLEGESLYDLVKSQGYLPQRLVIHYGIQLTDIMNYLHLAGTTPLLYLDLQPRNLLVCHGSVKLIDFDHAAFTDEANAAADRYGTVGCAAPEQYEKNGKLDERTDLYAIGVILHYLYTGAFPAVPYEPVPAMKPELAAIIRTCLEEKRERRFSSASELNKRLKQLEQRGAAANACLQPSPLMIALAGSKAGAGTTHIAVGLSVCLRNLGYPNLYEERNGSGMGAELGTFTGALRDRCGLMQYHGFVWKPAYGPGVKLPVPSCGLMIADYGHEVEAALAAEPDALILVCDGREWSREAASSALKRVSECRIPYAAVYNHLAESARVKPPEGIERSRCFRAPYFADPFRAYEGTRGFYCQVLESLKLALDVGEYAVGRRRSLLVSSWNHVCGELRKTVDFLRTAAGKARGKAHENES